MENGRNCAVFLLKKALIDWRRARGSPARKRLSPQSIKSFIVEFKGQSRHCDSNSSPMRYLKTASEVYATAIKLSPKEAKLHFKLGQILEEMHFVEDCFGFKQEVVVLL